MSLSIYFLVILAAFLHATWNGLVKSGLDKTMSMSAVVLGQALFGFGALFFVPAPAFESWPYLLLSGALHVGYNVFLMSAYRIGDLTQVYPIARGLAPVLVTIVSIMVLGIQFQSLQLLAIALIVLGIVSLARVRQVDGGQNHKAAVLAMITGCFIASYSMIDGIGARVAGTGVGFYAYSAIIGCVMYFCTVPFWQPQVLGVLKTGKMVTVLGGGASFTAYAFVVYAFTQAPIALVTALRETSIIFALFIGVFFLKERLDLGKVLSTFLTLTGAALMKLAKV